jgi:MYXO-CTERM domain-containing protein
MQTTNSLRRFIAGFSVAGAVLLTGGFAEARPEAPGELQEAAGMKCVPLCTMCHSGNPGTKGNWDPANRPLAQALFAPINSESDLKPAYDMWATMNPTLAALVKNGQEPKSGQDVCGPTYGCAVRIEKEAAAPRDFGGPLFVVGAVVLGGLLRRRRKTTH